jgi:UDP-GlcNAc:undecaprenyl-phosphate/decaprenyl-phosphate GlcNAc-1-phosphate transferase
MILFFSGMFMFSVLINSILLRFSKTLGIRNNPDQQIRWSSTVKPAVGGISFYILFLFSFLLIGLLTSDFNEYMKNYKILGLLIATTLAFLMGLADDAFDTNPLIKSGVQIFCSLIIMLTGVKISCFESEFLNYSLTLFWIVGIMNSINMLDNMDGITTIVSIMILGFFIAQKLLSKTSLNPQFFICVTMLAALSGFLIFNWHPSKMFMGDTGSQVLGVILAYMGIEFCWNIPTNAIKDSSVYFPFKNISLILTVFILPLTDTLSVSINRILKGNSPFVGGKDHTTHHLFFKGITEKKIALIFAFIGLISAISGISLSLNNSEILSDYIFYLILPVIVLLTLYLNTRFKKNSSK